MKETKQRHGASRGETGEEMSFISNNFAYTLQIKDLIEMLNTAHHSLRQTNQAIEAHYSKSQMLLASPAVEQFLDKIWYQSVRQTSRVLLYSIYGQQAFPLKTAVTKRNEMIGHLNIMAMNLGQKLKENVFDASLYFTTEEDLFNALLRVFHAKLFESPVFRKALSTANSAARFAARSGSLLPCTATPGNVAVVVAPESPPT